MPTKKQIITMIIITTVLIAGYLILINNFKDIEISFPIDSEEEAIAYAKTDDDVIGFIKEIGFKTSSNAHYNKEENRWEVIINAEAKNVNDIFYIITFRADGTILQKGPGAI